MLHVTLIYPSRQVQLPLVASHSLPFIVPSTWQLQPEKVVKMIIIKNFQNQSLRLRFADKDFNILVLTYAGHIA